MAVTSQIQHSGRRGGVAIQEWQKAGLLFPSVAKPVLFSKDVSEIERKLGSLEDGDRKKIRASLAEIFGTKTS